MQLQIPNDAAVMSGIATHLSRSTRYRGQRINKEHAVQGGPPIGLSRRDTGHDRRQDDQVMVDPFLLSEQEAATPQTKTLSLGQTIEEVKAAVGQPERILELGEKTVYVYKEMRIVFVAGKVVDIQ